MLRTTLVHEKPVVRDGHVAVGKIMRVTVSGDHRVVSGADVAEFLNEFKQAIENPMALLV